MRQPESEPGVREADRPLLAAQNALLARYAPETHIRRVRWSQGEAQVLELGAGPPLLLVHGGGDNALVWVPIFSALARSHHLVAVDRPGHGLADSFDYRGVDLMEHAATFLREVLDALDLPRVDVMANSMGALWSLILAFDQPERVSRLVIVGAPPGLIRSAPLPLRALTIPLLGRAIGRMTMANTTRQASRKFWGELLVAHPERLDDLLLDVDVAHTRRNYHDVLHFLARALNARGVRRHLVLRERWEALLVPTLFLSGERDPFMTRRRTEAWEALSARNPQVSIVPILDAGHLAWLDDPDQVVVEIERFLTA